MIHCQCYNKYQTIKLFFKHLSLRKILPKIFIFTHQISITYDSLRCHPHFCSFNRGNHTIAVVKGPEDYCTLSDGLKNVIDAVNTLIDDGYMLIDGRRVNLHFHFGGDYKVCNPSSVATKLKVACSRLAAT